MTDVTLVTSDDKAFCELVTRRYKDYLEGVYGQVTEGEKPEWKDRVRGCEFLLDAIRSKAAVPLGGHAAKIFKAALRYADDVSPNDNVDRWLKVCKSAGVFSFGKTQFDPR